MTGEGLLYTSPVTKTLIGHGYNEDRLCSWSQIEFKKVNKTEAFIFKVVFTV